MKHPLTALASLVAVLVAGTATPQEAPTAAPVVREVMTTMTVPASEAIFSATSEPPNEAAQWVALRASAEALVESGRLLTMVDRAKDDSEWVEMARALVTEAEATMSAVKAKDPEALTRAGDSLYFTCKTCHSRYMGQ